MYCIVVIRCSNHSHKVSLLSTFLTKWWVISICLVRMCWINIFFGNSNNIALCYDSGQLTIQNSYHSQWSCVPSTIIEYGNSKVRCSALAIFFLCLTSFFTKLLAYEFEVQISRPSIAWFIISKGILVLQPSSYQCLFAIMFKNLSTSLWLVPPKSISLSYIYMNIHKLFFDSRVNRI